MPIIRRRHDDDDMFDKNGVLRDGCRYRVPMYALDTVQSECSASLVRFGSPMLTGSYTSPTPCGISLASFTAILQRAMPRRPHIARWQSAIAMRGARLRPIERLRKTGGMAPIAKSPSRILRGTRARMRTWRAHSTTKMPGVPTMRRRDRHRMVGGDRGA
jgi:hypothetical protein